MSNNILEKLITKALQEAKDKGKELKLKKNKPKKALKKEATVTADNTKFQLRTGVNKNPTKLGIKIQFEPQSGFLDSELKSKLEVALQEKLNTSLANYDIQVSKDTDVPREDVIGFFIPLSQIKNLIVTSITGKAPEKPTVAAPEPGGNNKPAPKIPRPPKNDDDGDDSPPDDKGLDETHIKLVVKELLNEVSMKVRELNEISKVVNKDDFYEFINKGNNIIRTLEQHGMNNGKKYLEYLVKNNIM